ncbi:cytochrome c oxidase cbb3-type subunit 3 [Filomicrobium insigne]|uniref:Cbb3-type cytochrome c oxidase subunit n=2 Tax=Filomicrobium insigne TaxID=418854 RepID=A0A1H0QRB8_9HYPH|nr:cytochrome c oxidase cbb3-type subunit 3 [Filomicrobium insigne]
MKPPAFLLRTIEMSKEEIDEVTGVSTTGHEWDGIKELNNPMPRWWVRTFYATIIWGIAYTIAMPAWPMVESATKGVLGYSSRAELRAELDEATATQASRRTAIKEKSLNEILADDELRRFAISAGSAAFKVNCSQCHGSGAQGSPGYPNLNDDDWLWGGDIKSIYQSIAHGIRFNGDPDTRISEMPAFAGVLEDKQIKEVAAYVASLSNTSSDPALVEPGKVVYEENCAACHGDGGQGGRDMGAPNLVDAIWFYGASEAEIAAQVRAPKHGAMPAWLGRLGETTVKELAVYVHSLGGGEE